MSLCDPEFDGASVPEKFELVDTRDGARVVRGCSSGELMHPVGPAQEARTVYVGPARLGGRLDDGPVTVLDVGLGAGSNALAAVELSERRSDGPVLTILSFDRTIDAMALALTEPDRFGFDEHGVAAARSLLERDSFETARTRWRFVRGELPDTLEVDVSADVVFWDPYSPKTNPDLWNVAAFSALRRVVGPRATVHTFGAATATRSAMVLAGFVVGRGPATGTKSATTMAAVDPRDVEDPLDARWVERFERSSAPLPLDAPANAHERVRAAILQT